MEEKRGGYRFEYASSGRSKCKGPKPCSGTLINTGELRFGTPVDMKGMTCFIWRHWGCVTPQFMHNVKKKFEEASELDGYEALTPEDQARVIKAYQEGHVADEDIPESARKPADEGEEKPMKAGRKKADDDEGEPAEKPKKAMAGTSKSKAADASDAEEEEEKPKKKAPAKKAAAEPKEKAAPQKRTPKKKAESDDKSGEEFTKELDDVPAGSDEEEGEPEEEKPKKRAPAKKPAQKAKAEPKKKAAPQAKEMVPPKEKAPPKEKKAAQPRAVKKTDEDEEMADGKAEGDDADEGSSKKRKCAPHSKSAAAKPPSKKAKPASSKAKKSKEIIEDDEEQYTFSVSAPLGISRSLGTPQVHPQMRLVSTLNPLSKSEGNVSVALFVFEGQRKFLRISENYRDTIYAASRAFKIDDESVNWISLSTSSLDICKGRDVVIDGDAYSLMWNVLNEINVKVERSLVGAVESESIHGREH